MCDQPHVITFDTLTEEYKPVVGGKCASLGTMSQAGLPVPLSTREFDLLHVLMLNAGRVLSREQLEQHLYSWGQEVESNAIEVHIHHLRKKLGSELIRTLRGVGYTIAK